MPFTPEEKFVAPNTLEATMRPRVEELHRDVITTSPATDTTSEAKTDQSVDGPEERLLRVLGANCARPWSEVCDELGWFSSTAYAVRSRLEKRGLVRPRVTNLGKNRARTVVVEPSLAVLRKLGIDPGPGRGDPLHRHVQCKVKDEAEDSGFAAVIEECPRSTGEGPDVGLTRGLQRVATEVCVTSKPADEIANVAKNLRLGFDAVILLFVSRQRLDRARAVAQQRGETRAALGLVPEFRDLLRTL